MPKIKISLLQRSKALAFLAKGNNIDETVRRLRERYHPNYTVETVKRTYFPNSGPYKISMVEGKGKDEILARLSAIRQAAKRALANLKEIEGRRANDPVFDEQMRTQAREHAISMHKNPKTRTALAAAARRTIIRVNTAPEYAAIRSIRAKKAAKKRCKNVRAIVPKPPVDRRALALRALAIIAERRSSNPAFASRLKAISQQNISRTYQTEEKKAQRRHRGRQQMLDFNLAPEYETLRKRRQAKQIATLRRKFATDFEYADRMKTLMQTKAHNRAIRAQEKLPEFGYAEELVPTETPDYAEIIHAAAIHDAVHSAARTLTPIEQAAIEREFGISLEVSEEFLQKFDSMQKEEQLLHRNSAFKKLRRNEWLKKISE